MAFGCRCVLKLNGPSSWARLTGRRGPPSLLPAPALISLSDLPGASAGRPGQSGERPGHAGREAGARSRGQSLGSSCHKGAERGAARSGVEKQRPSVSSRVPSAGPLIFGTSDGVPDRPKHGAVWVPKSTSDRLQPSHLFRLGKVVVFFVFFFGGAVMRTMFPGRVPGKTTLSSSLSASVCLC